MILIKDVTDYLESIAPLAYQESYDNSGLITGNHNMTLTGVLICLDSTEDVITEAIDNNCNLVIAHHPIIFSGLKKITGRNYVERTIVKAIKNDIAIYAIHTNLDNVHNGVNAMIAKKLGLVNTAILQPKKGLLSKLVTFVPDQYAEKVRLALFNSGGGSIGNYDECSFNMTGTGTFRPGNGSNPFTGKIGERQHEKEERVEIIFESHSQSKILQALFESHPYEEIAYDIYKLDNQYQLIGSGMTGELNEPQDEMTFLKHVKTTMKAGSLRHTPLLGKPVKKIAICGGSGSFLLPDAIGASADVFITADFKYHQFFDADKKIVIADIGHYESEQFTIEMIKTLISEKFSTFAVRLTEVKTNPVQYI
jgi:dinuclear metal center YbgI/SA1388 family protein